MDELRSENRLILFAVAFCFALVAGAAAFAVLRSTDQEFAFIPDWAVCNITGLGPLMSWVPGDRVWYFPESVQGPHDKLSDCLVPIADRYGASCAARPRTIGKTGK
ncbi:MAG: hypothetical protein JOZ17_11990 [Acetobacteraceae bacterium]|nr:hypothetical protein [Acetobacteraceae bacterium]